MAINISPSDRVRQFPDDLHLRNGGQLWCIWCDRELGYRRKDSIQDHFKSKMHVHNKKARKKIAPKHGGHEENLKKLFEESDSDSEISFEGFDSPTSNRDLSQQSALSLSNQGTPLDDSRRSGRSRKRPARLSEDVPSVSVVADQAAFISSMAKKRKMEEDESSGSPPPVRMRSMPIKKQLSYSARKSDSSPPTSPIEKGSLKMKFSRKSGKQSDGHIGDKHMKVVAKTSAGKGLKLKLIWKKKHAKSSEAESSPQASNSQIKVESSTDDDSETANRPTANTVVSTPDNQVTKRMNNDEVSSASTKSSMAQSKTVANRRARRSSEGHLQPPQKKAKTKKTAPANDDRKRKVTAYMVWAKQMREKITKQYPGLEFADVSKKLGDMWKRLPDKAKQMMRVKNLAANSSTRISTAAVKKGGKMIETGPKRQQQPVKQAPTPVMADPEIAMNKELLRLPPPSTEPLDSAAYFSLLGESFSTLSAKTKTGSQVILGADTVLLDGLLCAMVPLISLLRQIPELHDCVDQATLKNCFSNIAHIVPGL